MWGWFVRMVMSRAIVANIVIGLLVALLVGGGGLAFYTKYKIEQGQALKWKVNELEIAIGGWQDKYEAQKQRALDLEKVADRHAEAARKRDERTAAMTAEINRLRRENSEVETYMAQPVPADLLERLSAHAAAAAARD